MEIIGVEHARSGKSSCKKCNKPIGEGEPRLMVNQECYTHGKAFYCKKCGTIFVKKRLKHFTIMLDFLVNEPVRK